jgi:acetolactate synthase small subunit
LGVRVVYADGQGILRDILAESTRLGFKIASVHTQQLDHRGGDDAAIVVTLKLQGQPTAEPLVAELTDHAGVLEVTSSELESSID